MNILIADDEPLIHKSIEKLISAHEPLASIHHVYNGNEMLKELEDHPIDLAYVDIKMPGLSGLDAIRQAKESISPFTRYYIMTGFNEFWYAKQAIKLKVDDYLMKPLDSATIQETLQAAVDTLKQNLEQKKNVFRNWLKNEIHSRNGNLYEYNGFYCCISFFHMDFRNSQAETLQTLLSSYEDMAISIFIPDGVLFLLFSDKPEPVRQIQKELSLADFPDNVTCFSDSVTNDINELRAGLTALITYSPMRVFFGLGRFYRITPLKNCSKQQLEYGRICIKWQESYIKKDFQAFTGHSESLITLFRQDDWSLSGQEHVLHFFAGVLNRSEPETLSYHQLRDIFTQAGRELLSSPSQDSKVQAIVQFINEHYKEDISTAELSKRFGLSANYISNLIKQELGIRYSEYITKLRLNYAKNLLVSTGLSVKDITNSCGYYSQSHFTKLFIEHEGCTPLEYRKTLLKGGQIS